MRPSERRYYSTDFEARAEGSEFRIQGHAAVFDRLSQDLGGFVERISRGAFTKTIQEADVRALFNHDASLILGRTKTPDGKPPTLRLAEDGQGLAYDVTMPDTSYARDLMVSIERGDITQSSFGFRVIDDSWDRTDDGFPRRTLREISLQNGDVSPVTYPAYLATDVATRAVEHFATKNGLVVEALAEAIRAGRLPTEVQDDQEVVEIPELIEVPEVVEIPDLQESRLSPLVALRLELMKKAQVPFA